MKKISTLLMMLCVFVGVSWAQANYEEIVGVKEVPATALDFSSQSLTTGYYLIKQTNTACTNKGFLKAANEAAGAVVTATSVNPTPNATNEATYVWYVEVGDADKFSIATANKKAAWQAPSWNQKNLVAYADKATTLELNTEFASLNQTTQTLVKAANGNTSFDGGYCYVHESGGNLGSWDDQNTKSLFYLEFYPVSLEQLVLKDTRFPELTTNLETPILYSIKNVRGNAYAEYNGASQSIQLHPSVRNVGGLFYFTAGETAGTYKIHNYATSKLCAGVNSWNDEGIDWYMEAYTKGSYSGLWISQTETATANGDAWNDYQNSHTSVAWYNGQDEGSLWKLDKFTGNVSDFDIKMSTESEKHLYFIKNDRVNKYANFEALNTQFTEENNVDYGSYWYFVEKTDAENVPEGFKACYIYNAAYNLPVENPYTGYMSALDDATYPAKVYYVGTHESTYWGHVMHTGHDGWNDHAGGGVTNWDYNTDGSIWSLIPANKTAAQLTQEATTAKNNALTLIAAAEEADFYTYADDAIATAKAAVEAVDVTTLSGAVSSLLNATVSNAVATLTATEKGTTGPVAGQYIQLKNRNYSKYLKATETGLTSVNEATDFATLWEVVEGTEGNVKLKNASTEKYIGEIRQSAGVAMVDEAEAKQFAFTNQTDVYAVFHETTGGGYAYGHIAGGNNLVGWEAVAAASQWIVSEVSKAEALAELQAIYDVVDNAFGDQPGQYQKTMQEIDDEMGLAAHQGMYLTFDYYAKDMLAPDAVVDTYMAKKTAATLKAQWDAVKTTVRAINAPAQGKFYRLKNVASGNYMNGLGNEVKLLADGASVHTTIFYLGENNTLVSYNSGRYLDCSAKGYSAVGDAKSGEFAMAYNGAQANVFTYKNNGYSTFGAGADGGNLDRGGSAPNQIGYNWILEEVTWLPIPVNVEAGWTSLYSPVELELSYNRFKAYTVNSVTSEFAKLTEQSVVPAGVGVVLELQDGAQIENGCVYLQIKATETTGVESMLLGTYADAYITNAAYALGLIDGEVGFYTASINVSTDTTNDDPEVTYEAWLNNGFKAYLPKTSGASLALRFNFGGETTAIESVLNNDVNVNAPIYDLSGRRVNNAVKGGIYIQNGKKFIVK